MSKRVLSMFVSDEGGVEYYYYTLLYHTPGIINRLHLALNLLLRRKHHTTQRLLVSATCGKESVYIYDARDLKNFAARCIMFKGN